MGALASAAAPGGTEQKGRGLACGDVSHPAPYAWFASGDARRADGDDRETARPRRHAHDGEALRASCAELRRRHDQGQSPNAWSCSPDRVNRQSRRAPHVGSVSDHGQAQRIAASEKRRDFAAHSRRTGAEAAQVTDIRAARSARIDGSDQKNSPELILKIRERNNEELRTLVARPA